MHTDMRRLKMLLRTKKTLREMAKALGVTHQTVEYHRKRLGYAAMTPMLNGRPMPVTRGAKHHSWRGGRFTGKDGYIMVMAPDAGRANKYVAEHILLWEQKLARRLDRHERVHHIDGNRSNNAPTNLHLCRTPAEHRRLHFELESICYELIRRGVVSFEDGHYGLT